jgi:hypothetical protein
MSRSLLISIHMYLSAFFAVFVLLVATSGGLYLLGIKGTVTKESVFTAPGGAAFSAQLDDPVGLKSAVAGLLAEGGIDGYHFEYVKVKGSTLYTRPTSRTHYVIELDEAVKVTRAEPSLQAAMMELHMGHGPKAFKNFQKFFAAGLIFIILSGLWLGLSSSRLRGRTLAACGVGAAAFFAVMLL